MTLPWSQLEVQTELRGDVNLCNLRHQRLDDVFGCIHSAVAALRPGVSSARFMHEYCDARMSHDALPRFVPARSGGVVVDGRDNGPESTSSCHAAADRYARRADAHM